MRAATRATPTSPKSRNGLAPNRRYSAREPARAITAGQHAPQLRGVLTLHTLLERNKLTKMTLEQKVERRSDLIAQAKAILNKTPGAATLSASDTVTFDRHMQEIEDLTGQIERERRSAQLDQTAGRETRSNARPPRGTPGAGSTTQNSAEKRAFADYMKFGIVGDAMRREQRDLSTASGPVGGFLIAQDFNPVLVEARKAWGALAYEVGQKVTKNGEPLRIAGVDDTANMSVTIGESTTGNPVSAPEVDPNFAGLINNVDFMTTGEIRISLAELQDSFFDLDAWIRDAFGKRIARGLANKIVTPGQSSNFQSIITTAPLSYTGAVGDTGAPTYADFVGMYAALDPAYVETASWVMNSTTRSLILKETDTLGRPLFVPNVNSDNLGTILGLPVVISQYHPNVGANSVGAVQLGSLKDAYTLRTAGEVSVLRLNERYADIGQVAFIGYHRNSGWASPVGKSIVNLVQAAS